MIGNKLMISGAKFYLFSVLILNLLGIFCFVSFFLLHGYLPIPFAFDKSDTFMDLFNPMYWAYNDGRYTEWKSVYPPLVFLVLKFIGVLFSVGQYNDPLWIRENSEAVIYGFICLYFLVPFFVLKTKLWCLFTSAEKILVYLVVVTCVPMLFALERGNIIIITPLFIALAVSYVGYIRVLSIAILINLKPYFAIFLLFYLARGNWRSFCVCVLVAGFVFIVTGLILDNNFLDFFGNLFAFSKNSSAFSLREVMTMPSSISAFSYVLKSPKGFLYALSLFSPSIIEFTIKAVEVVKWFILLFSMFVVFYRCKYIKDAEIFVLLVVIITNLGVFVGGYTLIFYSVLIPVFSVMRLKFLYLFVLLGLIMPLDFIVLMREVVGEQYSYLNETLVEVEWSMGLNSVLKPVLNISLLVILSFDFFGRVKNKKLRTYV